jgi:redox-sensitive bicupin YhaK (pirin superfamily)
MPEMDEGNLWGYQLWLKLPAALSMTEPGYQHIIHSHMAQLSENGISATIIAGKFDDTVGPAQTLFPVRYADFSIAHRGTSYTLSLTVGSVVVCYVHSGALVLGEEKIPVHRGTMVHCNNAGTLDIYAAEDGSGFLFMEAHPHHEPIVRGGPFVMNTPEEIHQAYRDYQRGLIG